MARLAQLEAQLRDYYARRRRLRDEIARSFPTSREIDREGATVVVVARYTQVGAPARADLFAELDRLDRAFAPTINEAREARRALA